MRILRGFGIALAAIGISFAATIVLVLLQPDRPITLLVYLPGIAIVETLAFVIAWLVVNVGKYCARASRTSARAAS